LQLRHYNNSKSKTDIHKDPKTYLEKVTIVRKLVKRYMNEMVIYAAYPNPNLSKSNHQHKTHLYLMPTEQFTKPHNY